MLKKLIRRSRKQVVKEKKLVMEKTSKMKGVLLKKIEKENKFCKVALKKRTQKAKFKREKSEFFFWDGKNVWLTSY